MAIRARKRVGRYKRQKRKMWLIRQSKKNLKIRTTRKNNKKIKISRRILGLSLNSHTNGSIVTDQHQKLIINLPSNLDFEENYEKTASHFAVLRRAVMLRKHIKSLDFSRLNRISPSAALVLASEVDQWNQKVKGKLKANLPSWNENVKRLLCEMGYFELLNLETPRSEWTKGNTTFFNFKRGQASKDHDNGQLAKELRIEIEKIVGHRIKKTVLFKGLSEAITNVVQHAYLHSSEPNQKRWWISGSFSKDEEKLCVTFYDQGIGIPETLPTSKIFEQIADFLYSWPDSRKIQAAMEAGRTSSGLEERGKGLQDLIEFAKTHRKGSLSIYSLKGMFKQEFSIADGESGPKLVRRDFANSIGGTLIEWSVFLGEI